jgi:DNA polymerase-3 subunit beta
MLNSIKVPTTQLSQALTLVGAAISKSGTLPILSNVCILVKNNMLHFVGCNNEIEQRISVPIEGDVEADALNGSGITIPHKKLFDLVKQANQDSVASITIDSAQKAMLKFSGQRSKYTLSTLPSQDYPYIDLAQSEVIATLHLPSAEFHDAMSPVEGAMAAQDVRYFLNGMFFKKDGNDLTLVATDGHRMSLNKMKNIECDGSKEASFILPRSSQKLLGSFLKSLNADDVVEVSLTAGHFVFKAKDKMLTSKLVDGRYPDYERVIPKDNDVDLTISRVELINACRRASILANEKFRGVRISLSPKSNTISLVSNNPENEEASEEVEIEKLNGLTGNIEIGINIDYLFNAATSMAGEYLDIKLRDENSSLLITDRMSEELAHVVMPMRI